jgi:hypothetical protein
MAELDLSTSKTVYVTRGPYEGRWMTMSEEDADAAVAGNWALEEIPSVSALSDEAQMAYQEEDWDEASMDAWLDSLEPEPPPPPEGETEVEPHRRRRKSRKGDDE